MHRRHRLLRGDVDAAGPHRRLLRRPRLRRGARRRDALDHARPSASSAACSPAGSATASAACARCSSARSCRASRCCCSCRSTAWSRSTWSRRCSACSRAASCPSYAIIVREYFPPREAGMRTGIVLMCDALRHGARRLDLGRDLRPDRLLPRGFPQRHRVEPAQPHDRRLAAAAIPVRYCAAFRPSTRCNVTFWAMFFSRSMPSRSS